MMAEKHSPPLQVLVSQELVVELIDALGAALDLILAPALAVSSDSQVLAANELAKPLLARHGGKLPADRVVQRRGPIVILAEPPPDSSIAGMAQRLRLSRRESQVLELLCRGHSNRAVARELGIAEVTVENHVTSILRKARVHSRAALLAKVLREAGGKGFP
jgi:DNA-binding NarL/FixJ family response regulator